MRSAWVLLPLLCGCNLFEAGHDVSDGGAPDASVNDVALADEGDSASSPDATNKDTGDAASVDASNPDLADVDLRCGAAEPCLCEGSCTVDCDGCELTCSPTSSCDGAVRDATTNCSGDCTLSCLEGACEFDCTVPGSDCYIDCPSTANCLLDCGTNRPRPRVEACKYTTCAAPLSCGSGVTVCNRPCP